MERSVFGRPKSDRGRATVSDAPTRDGLDLHPATQYNNERGVHIEVEGIDLYVTPEMLQLADSQGGISVESRLVTPAIQAVYDDILDDDMKVTVSIDPVEDDEEETDG